MGNLLGAPVTEKETHLGSTPEGLPYGVSSMQGWRIHMEDAHICQPFLYAEERREESGGGDGDASKKGDEKGGNTTKRGGGGDDRYVKIPIPGHSLYAVYDGHGGSFAADYSGRNFCRVLARQKKFAQYAKMAGEEAARAKAEAAASGKSSEKPAQDGEGDETADAGDREDGGAAAAAAVSDKKKGNSDALAEAKRQREMLTLLEDALRDAFVETDREILRELRGMPNEGANEPYG
eukprot:CAMPEP_0183294758 /NCGR_PEP_ID=MMETSP0160_2-20130417/2959_1 /TAXON_ID=2839 ORGANISM="Odontella Sinensis, Strain Grunow 1884" /NCGR_SAMPLE_ID=MMETSP0160_2 /ASSEMBLY_ACC=CAM_ASM_000250 /LENGTH=235 /DNA_ID=CAMNT_0025456119 /DNA_START=55 /DNA_END=759 /DNA_ORIENTATION=-